MLLALIAVIFAAGCVETRLQGYSQRPVPPQRDPAPPPPSSARADALVLTVGATLDTNGNGYPDLIQANVHLFDRRYAPTLREDGAFQYTLFPAGEVDLAETDPIRTWRIEGEDLQRAFIRSGFGLGFRFRLSLLENGATDRIDLSLGDIVCRFEPADGRDYLYAGEVSTIQLGRRVRVTPRERFEQPKESATEAPPP